MPGEHDPLCLFSELNDQPCDCELINMVRERCGREAQQAVAAMPLRSFPDGGAQAALIWRDGWQTGHDAAQAKVAESLADARGIADRGEV